MAFSFGRGKGGGARKSVGLDIGTSGVKMVAVEGVPGRFKLMDCALCPLDRVPGKAVPLESLTEAITKTVNKGGMDLSDLRISVSGKGVIVRHLDMPRMDPEELKMSIKYEAGPLLPFNLDDAITDFHVMDPDAKHEAKMRVLLAAAKKAFVQERVDLLAGINLVPKVISIDAIALANTFEAAVPEIRDDETVSAVNIGAVRSTLNVVSGKSLELTRDIEVGGDRATLGVARGLGIGLEEAEQRKREDDETVKEHILPMSMILARELKSTFDYTASKLRKKVGRIYLGGGGSLTPGLVKALEDEFGIDVLPWNPLLGFAATGPMFMLESSRGRETLLAVAAGLAIS